MYLENYDDDDTNDDNDNDNDHYSCNSATRSHKAHLFKLLLVIGQVNLMLTLPLFPTAT